MIGDLAISDRLSDFRRSIVVPKSDTTIVIAEPPRHPLAKASDKERDRALLKENIFRSIAAEVQRTGKKNIVMELCTKHSADLQRRGFSSTRLYNDYYKWLRNGRKISALLPATAATRGMPGETVDFIHGWMQRNKRSGKQGWTDFLTKHWQAGEPVPGYGTWRDWFAKRWPERPLPRICPPDLPAGWGYENLNRKLNKVENALVRQGVAAGLALLPSIPQTRADMRPLQFVTIDDVKLDFRVHCPDVGQPVDVVALPVLDIACALGLGFGARAALLQENGAKAGIKRRDVKAVIVHLLQTFGWPEYGMTIIHENGTASFDPAFIAAISEATGGLVTFSPASMLGGTVFDGGFADRAGGNTRAKSWLESWFNPLHNRLAAIEGQTGRRFDVSPQDDHGRRQELATLVKAGRALPAHLKAELRMPYRDIAEVRPLLSQAMDALNRRTDHACKDFEQMLVWRFREGDPWMSEAEQLDYPAEALARILTDTITESPMHRFQRLMAAEQERGTRFFALAPESVPRLLEDQRWIAVEGGEVKFQIEKKQCLYSPYTEANLPTLAAMEPGREYLAYYDASAGQIPPAVLYVTTGDGRWIGTLHHTAGFSRLSGGAEAKKTAIAQKKSMLAEAIARVNRNSPQVAEENMERIEQNLDVLNRAGALDLAPVPSHLTRAEAPQAHREISEAQNAPIRAAVARREHERKHATSIAEFLPPSSAAGKAPNEAPAVFSGEGSESKPRPLADPADFL